MSEIPDKIKDFIEQHHVLSLATSFNDSVAVCSLFYVFDETTLTFIVASSEDTEHLQNILNNNRIAGNILLETDEVGKIQGLQFKGEFLSLENDVQKELYFKRFPYSRDMNPQLWQIKADHLKMTDNTLGFGKKLIWP